MNKENKYNKSELLIKEIIRKYLISIIGLLGLVCLILVRPSINSDLSNIYFYVSFFAIVALSFILPYILHITGEDVEKNRVFRISYNAIDFFSIFIVACCLCQAFFAFLYFRAEVHGRSMEPTLYENEVIIGESTNDIKNFDIVVFKYLKKYNKYEYLTDLEDGDYLVKRMIAKGGDTFYIKGGRIYFGVEEKVIYEDYVMDNFVSFSLSDLTNKEGLIYDEETKRYFIKEGYYFLLGDNRGISLDSRALGLFRKSQLVGKVAYRVNTLFDWEKLQ